ncbi:MAG: rod-binding protein [Erythrobacter sp.]
MIEARSLSLSPLTGSEVSLDRGGAIDAERLALREAAEGFEAIMLRRMLESARAVSFTEDTPLTGGGLEQFEAMRDEHVAEAASKTGGFGIARSIEEQLSQHLEGHRGQ